MDNINTTSVYNNLKKNSKGQVINNYQNILTVFDQDENLSNIIRTNEFTQMKEINISPFWRRSDDNGKLWTDEDESHLIVYLGTEYNLTDKRRILEVLSGVFYKNSYNPIVEYLSQLEWDGVNRLEKLFIDYFGAEDNVYVKEVTKTAFIACVMRAFQPGSKHDTVVVLVGGQGMGKSHLLSKLGMEWYNESIQSFKGDEAYIKISTSWIIELSELTALKKGDSESIKAFISAKEDVYRPKYGKYPIQAPRKCVFFGTTNNKEFLRDTTGNRRWLPIQLNEENRNYNPFDDLDQKEVDQLWAEAKYYYDRGDKTILTNMESIKIAKELQEKHREDNGLRGRIEAFIDIPILRNWYSLSESKKQLYYEEKRYLVDKENLVKREKVCSLEIWHECFLNKTNMSKKQSSEINHILRQLPGWRETRTGFGKYGQQRGFSIER